MVGNLAILANELRSWLLSELFVAPVLRDMQLPDVKGRSHPGLRQGFVEAWREIRERQRAINFGPLINMVGVALTPALSPSFMEAFTGLRFVP